MNKVLLLVFALLMVACFEQGDCSDYSSSIMQLKFYSNTSKKSKIILIDSIKMAGWDTVMYKAQSVSSVNLPVNPNTDKMIYYLYYESNIATLDVSYASRTFALAPHCPAIDIISLKNATATVITDLKISQPDLTSHVIENIKLYF